MKRIGIGVATLALLLATLLIINNLWQAASTSAQAAPEGEKPEAEKAEGEKPEAKDDKEEVIEKITISFKITVDGKSYFESGFFEGATLTLHSRLENQKREQHDFEVQGLDEDTCTMTWNSKQHSLGTNRKFERAYLSLQWQFGLKSIGFGNYSFDRNTVSLPLPKLVDGVLEFGETNIEILDLYNDTTFYRIEGQLEHGSGKAIKWPNHSYLVLSVPHLIRRNENEEILLTVERDGSYRYYFPLIEIYADRFGVISEEGEAKIVVPTPLAQSRYKHIPHLNHSWSQGLGDNPYLNLLLTKSGKRSFRLPTQRVDFGHLHVECEIDLGDHYMWKQDWKKAMAQGEKPVKIPLDPGGLGDGVSISVGAGFFGNGYSFDEDLEITKGRASTVMLLAQADFEISAIALYKPGVPDPANPKRLLDCSFRASEIVTVDTNAIRKKKIKLKIETVDLSEIKEALKASKNKSSEVPKGIREEIALTLPPEFVGVGFPVRLGWSVHNPLLADRHASSFELSLDPKFASGIFHHKAGPWARAILNQYKKAVFWAEVGNSTQYHAVNEKEAYATQGETMRRYGFSSARISKDFEAVLGEDGVIRAKLEIDPNCRTKASGYFRDPFRFKVDNMETTVHVPIGNTGKLLSSISDVAISTATFNSLRIGEEEASRKGYSGHVVSKKSNIEIDFGIHLEDVTKVSVFHPASNFTMLVEKPYGRECALWAPPGDIEITIESRVRAHAGGHWPRYVEWQLLRVIKEGSKIQWRIPDNGADIQIVNEDRSYGPNQQLVVELKDDKGNIHFQSDRYGSIRRVPAGRYQIQVREYGIPVFNETLVLLEGKYHLLDYHKKLEELSRGSLRIQSPIPPKELLGGKTRLFVPFSCKEREDLFAYGNLDKGRKGVLDVSGLWYQGDILIPNLAPGRYHGAVIITDAPTKRYYSSARYFFELPDFEITAKKETLLKPSSVDKSNEQATSPGRLEFLEQVIQNVNLRVELKHHYEIEYTDEQGNCRGKNFLLEGETYQVRISAIVKRHGEKLPPLLIPIPELGTLEMPVKQLKEIEEWMEALDSIVTS